jgi:hypothetical protein
MANSTNAWAAANIQTSTTSANNYAGAMANSSNAAAQSREETIATSANNYAGFMANSSNAAAQSREGTIATSANNYAGAMANASNTWANTKVDTITSNSTSRIWANSVVVSGIETVYMDLARSGVTATTYGGTTQVPSFTVDTYGRIISASNVSFSGGSSSIGDETISPSTYYPVFTTITSGTMTSANVDTTGLTFVPSTGTLSSTIFNSLSDETLKENIEPIVGALEIINNMNGVGFNWKQTSQHSYGVIAQDMEKVVPDLVGNINNTKTVNYDGIIAFLIEAIKELNAKLESK